MSKKNTVSNYISISTQYEKYLSNENKIDKKINGKYYTPKDVALIMSQWFSKLKGKNICDVACGTGNLILTYFENIGEKQTKEIIKNNRLFLYDIDKNALEILKNLILEKYGKELEKHINIFCCDFLDKNIHLPNNCKVISNPPYSQIKELKNNWEKTEILLNTKEYYSTFMEKIIKESESSVIISPYSFLGGEKFYPLRQLLNNYNGFIVSFDNVPDNIFGKKYDVFNSNTSNSVRASITVIENKTNVKGFRISPLIRFKSEEREQLLKCEILEDTIATKYQIISNENKLSKMYCKCDKNLEGILKIWLNKSNKTFDNLLTKELSENNKWTLYFPNTCRYKTTCSIYELKRSGKYKFIFTNQDIFYFCYCFLNSSFCYWFWRMFDGGITYQKGLLLNMPMFFDILTKQDKIFFKQLATEMIKNESKYLTIKNNVGIQENINFPNKYRDLINKRLLIILTTNAKKKDLISIHKNNFFN